LQLPGDTIRAIDDLPHHGTNVGRGLGQDADALVEISVLVRGNRIVICLVKVVESDIGVMDDQVRLSEG
jgi:hypothetical protein